MTTNLRQGYLRKNGVPYSERAVFTEHWDVHSLPSGDKYLVNTNVVEDPVYLQAPFQTAIHYKFERETSNGIRRHAMHDSDGRWKRRLSRSVSSAISVRLGMSRWRYS